MDETEKKRRVMDAELVPRPDSAFLRFLLGTPYLRVIGRRIVPLYSIRTSEGIVLHLRSNYDFDAATVAEVVYRGIYERFFKPDKGQVVIDVGAHIGSFTVKASMEVGGEGHVVALEPSSSNFKMLRMNVQANHCDNVTALNVAAGSKEDTGLLKLYARPGGNSFYRRELEDVGTERVSITTLDSVTAQSDFGRVDFIKIDVEGYELEVLRGAAKTLDSFHPNIAMETHDFGPSSEELAQYLQQFDYSVKSTPYGSRLGLMYASRISH